MNGLGFRIGRPKGVPMIVFDSGEARPATATEVALWDYVSKAWQEGKNAGAADSAQIIGWGVSGADPAERPVLSTNPYVAQMGACPTCEGDDPLKHPMVGGEVQLCRDPWHTPREYPSGRLIGGVA